LKKNRHTIEQEMVMKILQGDECLFSRIRTEVRGQPYQRLEEVAHARVVRGHQHRSQERS
jgi:hypothetical protein